MLHVILVNKDREVNTLLNDTVQSAMLLEGVSGATRVISEYEELPKTVKAMKKEPAVLFIVDLHHVEWLDWQVKENPYLQTAPIVVVSAVGSWSREKFRERAGLLNPESVAFIGVDDQERVESLRPIVKAFMYAEPGKRNSSVTSESFRAALNVCGSEADYIVPPQKGRKGRARGVECSPQ